eukprot:7271546-Prymnesium_polylepis.1
MSCEPLGTISGSTMGTRPFFWPAGEAREVVVLKAVVVVATAMVNGRAQGESSPGKRVGEPFGAAACGAATDRFRR